MSDSTNEQKVRGTSIFGLGLIEVDLHVGKGKWVKYEPIGGGDLNQAKSWISRATC